VVIAYLYNFSLSLGALAAGILTALGIGLVSRNRRLKEDTAIGVLFAGMFALGIVFISTTRTYKADLGALLFGNVLGVSNADLAVTAALGATVLAILYFTYKELLLASFDRTMAAAMGLPVAWLDQLLLLLLTLTIIVSLQAVGNILVVAMLIIPAATARLYVERFPAMMALGAMIGALSGILGLYLSYYQTLASGATIVLLATLGFALSFVFSPRYGLIAHWFYRRQLK
jgi:ABC-type Mn2+/Zn2+ transport system permease subunit